MAFAADTVVIWDPLSGSNNNGGGFAASDGGARITTAVAYDDLVIDGADNTKITSAADRAFVANDAGNWLNVMSGTGWTVQRARIVSVAAGVATMDRAMGTVESTAGTGNLGGYLAVFTDALLELSVSGMVHQVWATATMTLTESIACSVAATAALPVIIDGRASDGSASPQGDNRPLIAAGGYTLGCGTYWTMQNLRVSGTGWPVVSGSYGGLWVINCKIANTSASNNYAAISDPYFCYDCELSSTNGWAVILRGGLAFFCYFRDSKSVGAASFSSSGFLTMFCVFDNCGTGIGGEIQEGASRLTVVLNCVANACTTGMYLNRGGVRSLVANNIISNCTTGISIESGYTQAAGGVFDYNDLYNCTTDRSTGVPVGAHDNDVDPGYTDSAADDFSTGANVDDTGFGIRVGVG